MYCRTYLEEGGKKESPHPLNCIGVKGRRQKWHWLEIGGHLASRFSGENLTRHCVTKGTGPDGESHRDTHTTHGIENTKISRDFNPSNSWRFCIDYKWHVHPTVYLSRERKQIHVRTPRKGNNFRQRRKYCMFEFVKNRLAAKDVRCIPVLSILRDRRSDYGITLLGHSYSMNEIKKYCEVYYDKLFCDHYV